MKAFAHTHAGGAAGTLRPFFEQPLTLLALAASVGYESLRTHAHTRAHTHTHACMHAGGGAAGALRPFCKQPVARELRRHQRDPAPQAHGLPAACHPTTAQDHEPGAENTVRACVRVRVCVCACVCVWWLGGAWVGACVRGGVLGCLCSMSGCHRHQAAVVGPHLVTLTSITPAPPPPAAPSTATAACARSRPPSPRPT